MGELEKKKEITSNVPQPIPSPLDLEVRHKLKVYAITGLHKDITVEQMAHKIGLAMVVTYTDAEAIIGAGEAIRRSGQDPQNYKIPYQIINIPVENFLPVIAPPVKEPMLTKLRKEGERKKNISSFVNDVRYVFDAVGTAEEKEIARKVILKFNVYVKEKQTDNL